MKKILLICTFLLFIAGISFSKYPYNKEEQFITFEAKTDDFNSLSDLENSSPIIVQGVKMEDADTKLLKSKIDGSVNGGYTEATF
jgi:hypothetical protein